MRRTRVFVEPILLASRQVAVGLLAAVALVGCASQEALTAKATDCTRFNLTILPSKYREQGSTTTWCAACKEQRYRCNGNADRTRVECRPLRAEDAC